MKTETPKTDAMGEFWRTQLNYRLNTIPADFARKLERDRDTWKCRASAAEQVLDELHKEVNRLRRDLAQAATDFQYLSQWRKEAHEYDRDRGHRERDFDREEWESMELFAETASRNAAVAAGQELQNAEVSHGDGSATPLHEKS